MSRKQKIVIMIGAPLIALVSLFPPWTVIDTTGEAGGEQRNIGFCWVLDKRTDPAGPLGVTMVDEAGRDGFQVAPAVLTIAAVVLLGKDRHTEA